MLQERRCLSTISHKSIIRLLLRETDMDEMKIVLKRPSQASAMTAPRMGVKYEKAMKPVMMRDAVACSRPSAPGILLWRSC